jgi:hypothetical protein
MPKKIQVPVFGTAGKVVTIAQDATVGAEIGKDLFLPGGKLATLAELKRVLVGEIPSGNAFPTLWNLIREIPSNIVQIAGLAVPGVPSRNASGTWSMNSDWATLATRWSVEPAFVETIGAGDVYEYALGAQTAYRLVPQPYDPAADAFYSSFTSPTLAGLIASRG